MRANADIPLTVANCKLWLKADSLVLNNNDPVGTWTDSSGTGNSPTATGTDRPTYKTSIVNSKPVVRFASPQKLTVTFAASFTQPATVFAVCDLGRPWEGQGATRQMLYSRTAATFQMFAGTSQFGGANGVAGTFRVVAAIFNGASSKLWLNGGSAAISANAGTAAQPNLSMMRDVGGTTYPGDVAELIAYSASLSLTDINTIGSYLATKYARTWTTAT